MRRSLRWKTREGGGLEHLALEEGDAILAQASVIGPAAGALYEGELFGCAYRLECDARWRVRRLAAWVAGGATLALVADGEGRWTDGAGAPLPALDGCIDVDLSCTPFTNTLPLRRLGVAPGRRHEILVAFVEFPSLSLRAARQAYTGLATGHVLFESLDTGFRAELALDADGLVLDYPGLFARLA